MIKMDNMFCIWCGARMENQGEHFSCGSCGVIYTDAALSRTVSDGEDSIAVETTVTLECLHIEPRIPRKVPIPARLPESAQSPAEIYC